MIEGGLQQFCGRNILLLQGPFGPFFWRFAQELRSAGAVVHKVNFNGGDALFYPAGAFEFRGKLAEWPEFLERVLHTHRIDVIFLFGDCRPIHGCVSEMADKLNIEVGVFEEGYVRPNYITLERSGVNARSGLPREADFYRSLPAIRNKPAVPVGNSLWHAVFYAILYYTACILFRPLYPFYRHHRELSLAEGFRWLMCGHAKRYYGKVEEGLQERFSTELSGRYFLLPLQVHNDAQVLVHSDFPSVEAFVRHVLESFAASAPSDTYLVIKHHPLDRVYRDYTQMIADTASGLGISERIFYIHDQHLPTLVRHARGLVTLNSTVGMSALLHGTPVICFGRAIFDIEGITSSGSLAEFWQGPKPFDEALFRKFRCFLIRKTQLNGNYYKRIPGSMSGIRWEERKPGKKSGRAQQARALRSTRRRQNVPEGALRTQPRVAGLFAKLFPSS